MDDKEKQSVKNKRILREMEREKEDIVKIFNPMDKDYTFMYDARYWVVPNKDKDTGYGKGCLDTPRYIGKHYRKHIINKLINDENEKKLEKIRKKSEAAGNFYPQEELKHAIRTDNPAARKKWLPIVWKGVVKEFAIATAPLTVGKPKVKDDRPLDDQLMEDLENEPVEVEAPLYIAKKDRVKEEVKTKKEDLAKEIA